MHCFLELGTIDAMLGTLKANKRIRLQPTLAFLECKSHFYSPGFFSALAQMTQKQKSRTLKCPLMQDWVFKLGTYTYSVFWQFDFMQTVLNQVCR